jgi:hypothetical protein
VYNFVPKKIEIDISRSTSMDKIGELEHLETATRNGETAETASIYEFATFYPHTEEATGSASAFSFCRRPQICVPSSRKIRLFAER